MANKKIQVSFLSQKTANLFSSAEMKKIELAGVLGLASDFKVKNDEITRISKVNVPILLSKTKTGKYVAFNPASSKSLKIPIVQLPGLQEINAFCQDPNNLNLEKLRKKLQTFKVEEVELKGGVTPNQLRAIDTLLKGPRDNRTDFVTISPTIDLTEMNSQLSIINQMVYDEKSLNKAIKDRLDAVENALSDNLDTYIQQLKDRTAHWKREIDNSDANLQKRIKERDVELDREIKVLGKETDKKVKDNLKLFLKGFAKNVRTDEKPIEKLILQLEKYASQTNSPDIVDEIKEKLIELEDFTNIFMASVRYASRQTDELHHKEIEILELSDLSEQGKQAQAERDKRELIGKSKSLEKDRDRELNSIKKDKNAANDMLAKFKDVRSRWESEIKIDIDTKGTEMLPPTALNLQTPSPIVEFNIPMYILQYKRKNDTVTVAVPPIRIPNSMKNIDKSGFSGPHGTLYFETLIPQSDNFLGKWIQKATNDLEISTQINAVENLMNDPKNLRETFFTSKKIMTETLKVNKKKWDQVNERLTEAFSE